MRSFVLFLTLMTCATIAPAQNGSASKTGAVENELRESVRAWDIANIKGDIATLDRLLADEFAFVGGQKKADYLAAFKTRPPDSVQSAVSTDVQVEVYGNAAVVTGLDTITGRRGTQPYEVKWLYMDVWIKRSGRWQCVKTYASRANQ